MESGFETSWPEIEYQKAIGRLKARRGSHGPEGTTVHAFLP